MVRKVCTKVGYRDRIAAEFALSQAQRRRKPTQAKDERRVYRCPDCRRWHVTSWPSYSRPR